MTSMAQSARRTAGRARNSSVLEALTRGGFVGYGLPHLAAAGFVAFGGYCFFQSRYRRV